MKKIRNILFIMADQLRWDYLSCYGHPHLKTPHIDNLAKKGVQFNSAFVQSPVCGPSRASYYTGRTVFSHGSTWNQVPLPIGELTIGDYLRQSGIRTGVVGKTHMRPDLDGMSRLGITKDTEIGLIVSEPGFDPYERDDGLHPNNQIKNSKKTLPVSFKFSFVNLELFSSLRFNTFKLFFIICSYFVNFPKKLTKIPPTFEAKLKLNNPNIFFSIIKITNSI